MEQTLAIDSVEVNHLLVSQLLKSGCNARMDMHAVRRRNLRALIDADPDARGSVAAFGRKFDIDEARLSQLLSATYRQGRNFGEKAARGLEEKLNVSPLTLDNIAPTGNKPYPGPERRLEHRANQTGPESAYAQFNGGPNLDLRGGRYVAIVGTGRGGPDGYISIDDFPPGQGDGFIFTYSPDSTAYAIRVRGDSMRPRIKSGEYIVAETMVEAKPGDDVVVKLIDDRAMVKELLWIRDEEISLGSINDTIPPITIPMAEVKTIHRVAAIVPRGSALIKSRDE